MAAPWTSAWTMATRRVDSVTIIVLTINATTGVTVIGREGRSSLSVEFVNSSAEEVKFISFFFENIPYKTNYLGHERFFNCSK